MTATRRSDFALRFFAISAALLFVALSLSSLLLTLSPTDVQRGPTQFPLAFAASTVLLCCGSVALSRALGFVKLERQHPFRRSLMWALLAGTLFVGFQTFALSQLIHQQPAEEVPTGVGAFVAVMAALHAMHFVVALLCLVYVTVQAFADRYDHEYFWGVTVCTWFWHALGVVWCAILAVMAIAAR
jgi:heme/copper-type cytochrome/quinol oxidase subunit 3